MRILVSEHQEHPQGTGCNWGIPGGVCGSQRCPQQEPCLSLEVVPWVISVDPAVSKPRSDEE